MASKTSTFFSIEMLQYFHNSFTTNSKWYVVTYWKIKNNNFSGIQIRTSNNLPLKICYESVVKKCCNHNTSFFLIAHKEECYVYNIFTKIIGSKLLLVLIWIHNLYYFFAYQ